MDTFTPDAPVVETPAVPDESSSLSDHEATYTAGEDKSPAGDTLDTETETGESREDRDERGRFRHRASSQRASADDVPQINALTKELRAAEAELFKIKPDAANETPRTRALKRQIAAVRAELNESAPKPEPAPMPAPAPRQPLAAQPVVQATRPKPTEDEVGSKYQTYADFVEDLADWRFEQREAKSAAVQAESRRSASEAQMVDRYNAKIEAFARATPDFIAKTEALRDTDLPSLLCAAIMTDDKAAEYVYHLAQHPALIDDLFLLTDGKPVTGAHVATVQRRLSKALTDAQAATTGSAAVVRPAYIPPRPPNPVRTGPIRTGDDLPGDESSLADHERAFARPRR